MKTKTIIGDWTRSFKDYFTFSRAHRRGSLFLLGLICVLCSGFFFIDFLKPQESYDYTPFIEEIKKFERTLAESSRKKASDNDTLPEKKYFSSVVPEKETALFEFDPNTIQEEEMYRLGFSPGQARVIVNFRNKGGSFRKKEDLKKIYGISKEEYLRLSDFIVIPDDTNKNKFHEKKSEKVIFEKTVHRVYELNNISLADLDSIRGIGPVIAASIIRYRNRLGGFVSLEQLREVYGVDSTLFEKIKGSLTIEPRVFNKININTEGEDGLKHPYFNRQLARLVVNYRKLHGPYRQVEDLRKLALVNEEIYSKLAPYLSAE